MTDFKSEAAEEIERLVERKGIPWSMFFVLGSAFFFAFRVASWIHTGHVIVREVPTLR